MDEYSSYYLNGFYGIPLTAVRAPMYDPQTNELHYATIEDLLRLNYPWEPIDPTVRIYNWMDAQDLFSSLVSPGVGTPQLGGEQRQDYGWNANNTPAFDHDYFIGSEIK